mgnify:CR=1 FL=1
MAYKFATIKELPEKHETDSPIETDIDLEGEEACLAIRANSSDFMLAKKILKKMKYYFDVLEREALFHYSSNILLKGTIIRLEIIEYYNSIGDQN